MTNDPARWGKTSRGAPRRLLCAKKELGVAAIGGKDSMSGTFKDIDVPPTLCAFCVAPVLAANVITPRIQAGRQQALSARYRARPGGMPDFEDVKQKYDKLHKMIRIKPWSPCGRTLGSMLAGAAKCAFGNGRSVKLFRRIFRSLRARCTVRCSWRRDIADPDFTLVGEIREEPFIEAMGEASARACTRSLHQHARTGIPYQNCGRRTGGLRPSTRKRTSCQQIWDRNPAW